MVGSTRCGTDLLHNHTLDSPLGKHKEGSRIIEPRCTDCGEFIELKDVETNISSSSRTLLIARPSSTSQDS